MFKNPLASKHSKKEIKKLHRNVRNLALKKALRTGSRDAEGRAVRDADRNRDD